MAPTARDTLAKLGAQLEERRGHLARLRQYWLGEQPAAFLSKSSRLALDSRLARLGVNMPRLVTRAHSDRLQVRGFRVAGAEMPDVELARLWRMAGLTDGSELAITDALFYGSAYITAWGQSGRPTATVDSARNVILDRDRATGEVLSGVRIWNSEQGSRAMVYQPDKITPYSHGSKDLPAASGGWIAGESIRNPLGVVPVVELRHRTDLEDQGSSIAADILDLTDALNKVLADAMVTSETYARPRRWVSGLEIVEDEDGKAIPPFDDAQDRVWQSEDPATKFGQLDAARLDGHADLTASITQQIGALSGLPPHYLGLHGDQPASADATRAAEASLVAACYQQQRIMGPEFARVAALLDAAANGTDPDKADIEVIWESPETRTPAQQADAAAKLIGIGVPLAEVLADTLGYTPEEVARSLAGRRAERLDRAGTDLSRLLP